MNFGSCIRSFCHRFNIVCGRANSSRQLPEQPSCAIMVRGQKKCGGCVERDDDRGLKKKKYRVLARQMSGPFFSLQRNRKVVAAVELNKESSSLLLACCCCIGWKVRLQAKQHQQQMLFCRFQPRETRKHAHFETRFQPYFPCFCVFTRASTHSPRAFDAIWKSIFHFAAEIHTNTHADVCLICSLGFS